MSTAKGYDKKFEFIEFDFSFTGQRIGNLPNMGEVYRHDYQKQLTMPDVKTEDGIDTEIKSEPAVSIKIEQ